jgi:methionine-rich copper-binding protein CopC
LFREQIAKSLPVSYLKYFNSFLLSMSQPPIEPGDDHQTAQNSPAISTSESGIDVVGFLIDLFTSDKSTQHVVQATQSTIIANPKSPASTPVNTQPTPIQSTQPTQPTQHTTAPTIAVTATLSPATATATQTAPVVFLAPPRPPRLIIEPPVIYPTVDTTVPGVTGTNPANGATNILISDNILITFSEAVTVSGASFTINCAGVQAYAVYGSGTNAITLDPTVALPSATLCTVTVTAAQVFDIDGVSPPDTMSADYTFTFTTQAPPADTAPNVTSTTPADTATNVVTSANIVVNFSEAVTVSGASFTINCAGVQAFTFAGSGTNAITLTPSATLPISTLCTVTVVAIQVSDVDAIDPPDTMAVDYTFTFTTAADNAPNISSTTPANGAIGVPANTTVVVTFSESVNVTGASFTIECPVGTPQTYAISGTGTNIITLTPTLNLPAALCTVTVVGANVSDADVIDPPDTMAADYVFTFTTP